jgi:hypothetical protein
MRVKSENKFKTQFERNSYSLESESENSQPEIRVKPNKLKHISPLSCTPTTHLIIPALSNQLAFQDTIFFVALSYTTHQF